MFFSFFPCSIQEEFPERSWLSIEIQLSLRDQGQNDCTASYVVPLRKLTLAWPINLTLKLSWMLKVTKESFILGFCCWCREWRIHVVFLQLFKTMTFSNSHYVCWVASTFQLILIIAWSSLQVTTYYLIFLVEQIMPSGICVETPQF